MLKFWVRSISLGLLAAIAIIMVTPSLRAKLMPVVEQPRNIGALQISFNEAVRKAALPSSIFITVNTAKMIAVNSRFKV